MRYHVSIADQIIDYESGNLGVVETIRFFSELVKNGMAWSLQGHYGRTAQALIDRGILDQSGDINNEVLDELLEEV